MPFDGLEPQSAQIALALNKLIWFFADKDNWYQEDYCRQLGAHSYARGRRCLSGALEGARPEVRVYVKQALLAKTGQHSVEAFNATATHASLLAVLAEAQAMALTDGQRQPKPAVTPEPRRPALASMKPKPGDAPPEVALLDDLIALFELPGARSEDGGGFGLSQAIHHFRAERRMRGDRTAAYLRRAFRGMPWTFGSLKAFDARASRNEILRTLCVARELALADIATSRPVPRLEPLRAVA